MDYRKEIHKLVDSIEQEAVLAFLASLIRHVVENKDIQAYFTNWKPKGN